MSTSLEDTLRADAALARAEDDLIRRARALYAKGFTPGRIAPSQMAALEEKLMTAGTYDEAVQAAGAWLGNQLEKLERRKERTGRRRSWLLPPSGGAGAESLGKELLAWLHEKRFLGEPAPDGADTDSGASRPSDPAAGADPAFDPDPDPEPEPGPGPGPGRVDPLAALRVFWSRFHVLFRYEAAFEHPMDLRDPAREPTADSDEAPGEPPAETKGPSA